MEKMENRLSKSKKERNIKWPPTQDQALFTKVLAIANLDTEDLSLLL
jgi:hypothetical protein